MTKTIKDIAAQIHERVTIITNIINRKQAKNRVMFTSEQWHIEYNKLAAFDLDYLKSIN